MSDDQHRFLALLGQLPARLTAEQVAWVLNCQAHDVPILVMARLLKPLGNPATNSVKYFATMDVLELTKDRTWCQGSPQFQPGRVGGNSKPATANGTLGS
jgi:hypothetical protein